MKLVIEPTLLTYPPEDLEKWKAGDRSECIDTYCRRLSGSSGFGEYIGGRFYQALGFEWIHHDFDIFGTNKDGKYPKSDQILLNALGQQKLRSVRSLTSLFGADAAHTARLPGRHLYHQSEWSRNLWERSRIPAMKHEEQRRGSRPTSGSSRRDKRAAEPGSLHG